MQNPKNWKLNKSSKLAGIKIIHLINFSIFNMITFHGTFFSTYSKGPKTGAFAHCILCAPILVAFTERLLPSTLV